MGINFTYIFWGYWRWSRLGEKIQDKKDIVTLLGKAIYTTALKKILR